MVYRTQQDIWLVCICILAFVALVHFIRYLFRMPTIEDVHDMLRYDTIKYSSHALSSKSFGTPHVAIQNAHVRVRYWHVRRIDILSEYAEFEVIACTTYQHRYSPLMICVHGGQYLTWIGSEKKPRHMHIYPADKKRLDDIYALMRKFNSSPR